ncbi:MAG: phosphatase PAP2 family protein [Deltaproteobacteria bacterium]|nr:phosphatase PAP2 family protein [Deltaproteobacteria bacterium]
MSAPDRSRMFSPPLSRRERLGLGLAAAGTLVALAAMAPWDRPWSDALRGREIPGGLAWFNHSLANGEPLGFSDVATLAFVGVWGLYLGTFWIPRLPSSGALRAQTGMVVASGVVTAILVQGLKLIVSRPRPNHLLSDVSPSFSYSPWYLPGDLPPWFHGQTGSFPSGHTATVAVLAAFWFLLAKSRRAPVWLLGLALLLLAGMVLLMGWGRLAAGEHWPTDIVGGAALGWAVPWALQRAGGGRGAGAWNTHPAGQGWWAMTLCGKWLGVWLLAVGAVAALRLGGSAPWVASVAGMGLAALGLWWLVGKPGHK